MTSRERVLAAANGQPADRKPIVIWPHDEMYSDVAIVSSGRLGHAGSSRRLVLAEVLSPFARALGKGTNLVAELSDAPGAGGELLRSLVDQIKEEIAIDLDNHADGIFYRLQGAEPEYTTPMEYGGHFLEVDRELLEFASGATFNMLFVEGGPDLYIDFVSDLPAHAFAWDIGLTEIELERVRNLRKGALATSDPSADILFGSNYGLLKQWTSEGGVTNARL